jgi:hypothetical protein
MITFMGAWSGPQIFLTRMTKDGRIVIPQLIITIFQEHGKNLEGYIVDVTMEPM